MSSLFDNKKELQDSKGNKAGFVIVTLFLIWLFFPNNNSFIKLSYWSNNLVYNISKMMHKKLAPDYIHYRNNAIYLAKIYPKNSERSINEMNKAINSIPEKDIKKERGKLYKDRAVIKLFYGDKAGALEDYLSAEKYDANDNFRIAILLTDEAKYSKAIPYCDNILYSNKDAILGHVCLSYVYEKYGDIQSAETVYDSLIEKNPKNEIVFIERSHFKQRIGDEQGQHENMAKAKKISSHVNEKEASVIEKAVNFKELPLPII